MKIIKYYLPDINFNIKVNENLYNSVKDKVDESIIYFKKNSNKIINIEYQVNEEKFERFKKIIKEKNGKIYDSFKNQTHKEVNFNNIFYYLVNTEEYICIKFNESNYMILVKNNSENSRNWIARIIRELYLREKEDIGFSFMHGTGIEVRNRGILLLGTSGSGKTTLAVKFMELDENKKFLSNDRVLIDINNNMDYFPHAVTYAMGTVKNNKYLDAYFRENNILEKKKKIKYEDATNEFDCNTPLTDVAKVFDKTEMSARTKLTDIIYPRFEKDAEQIEVTEMTREEKMKLLITTNFTPIDTEALRNPWLRKRKISEDELQKQKENLLENIIENINIKKIKYGVKTNVEDIIKYM